MFGLLSAVTSGLLTSNMLKNLKNRVQLNDVEFASLKPAPLEELTLAIPARDEFKNLSMLLPQIVDQQLRPKKLLVLDDHSSDGTAELVDSWAKKYSWIERREGQPLPAGWRGKVWALHQLLREVETDYVLFIDADVRLRNSYALNSLWKNAKNRIGKSGFVSVFPRPLTGLSASLLVHQIYTHLYYFLPFNADKIPSASAVAGCGQVMLFRPKEFEELGGYGRIRSSTHDGLQLARIFKGAGRRVFAFDGGRSFGVEMYRDFKEAFIGFSRNDFEATRGWPATIAISGILFWVFVLPFFILPVLLVNPAFLVAFLIMLYGQMRMAQEFDLGLSHVILTPVKASASILVHLWSTTRHQFGLPTRWRNRLITG